jgi:hypothetical protein
MPRLWWPWKPIPVSGLEHGAQGADAGLHVVRQHVAGAVGHIHRVGAVALHQLALAGDALGVVEVGHHQEAGGVHAQLAGKGDVLGRGVGLGAVGGHVHAAGAAVVGRLQLAHGAQAGDQQHRHLGLGHLRRHGRDVFLVAVGRKAVLQGIAAQAGAVGDLDIGHTRRVQGGGDLDHLVDADLFALGMHAVTQAHVVQDDFLAFEIHESLRCKGCSDAAAPGRGDFSRPRTSIKDMPVINARVGD